MRTILSIFLLAAFVWLPGQTARADGVLFEQAQAAYRTGDYQAARVLFNKAILEEPDKMEIFLGSAKLWLKSGELRQAMDDAQEALRLAPAEMEPHCLLAYLRYLAGEGEEARRCLEEAQLLFPDSALFCYAKAVLYEEFGYFDQAADGYAKALRLYKKTPRKLRQDGLAEFADCINCPPFDKKGAALYLRIGITQSKAGNFRAAWRSLRRAVRIKPELSVYLPITAD